MATRHETYSCISSSHSNVFILLFQAKRISTGEFAAIKVIKLEQGDDFGIIQQEILMMKVTD